MPHFLLVKQLLRAVCVFALIISLMLCRFNTFNEVELAACHLFIVFDFNEVIAGRASIYSLVSATGTNDFEIGVVIDKVIVKITGGYFAACTVGIERKV